VDGDRSEKERLKKDSGETELYWGGRGRFVIRGKRGIDENDTLIKMVGTSSRQLLGQS